MRKKLSFLLLISFVMVSALSAQKKKVRFQSVNQFAMVGGENHVNTAFQTINGIKFSNWFSGIGIIIIVIKHSHYLQIPDGILEKIKKPFCTAILDIIFP